MPKVLQVSLHQRIKASKTNLYQSKRQKEIQMAMVDVSGKAEIFREATATGTIKLKTRND